MTPGDREEAAARRALEMAAEAIKHDLHWACWEKIRAIDPAQFRTDKDRTE